MKQNIPERTLEFIRFNNKYFIITSILFVIGYSGITFFITRFNTGFLSIIFLLSTLVVFSFIIINKNRNPVIFKLDNNNLTIIEGEKEQNIKTESIDNFNSYGFVFRKMGYIIRIKFPDGNKYYFLTSHLFLKWKGEGFCIQELTTYLTSKIKKKYNVGDIVIYFSTYIFFPLLLLTLLLIFMYLNKL